MRKSVQKTSVYSVKMAIMGKKKAFKNRCNQLIYKGFNLWRYGRDSELVCIVFSTFL